MREVSPSIARIGAIARELDELRSEVVFIGGAIAPLLQTEPTIPRVRATKDVDVVVASTSYSGFDSFVQRLRQLGFSQEIGDTRHARRWRSPSGIAFDVVPAGEHLGGSGNEWDAIALATAVETEIEPGLMVRHASAPGFLAMKWKAFTDGGMDDPFLAHDLEDMLALIVSREAIVEEVRAAPEPVQAHLREGFRWLLQHADCDDLVAAHLANAYAFKETAATLRQRLSACTDDTDGY